MASDCRQLRLFLKAFVELCSRRRSGLDPALRQALCSILIELDNDKVPPIETLLEFEMNYNRLASTDPHLRYLHCVLKGFRERKHRPVAPDPIVLP